MITYNNDLINGDCLEVMKQIKPESIDMILCDLPYGTTSCKWDSIIPLDKLWIEYERIIKTKGAIVCTASQPFTTTLISSNMNLFRYEIIWEKNQASNIFQRNTQPLKYHENILIFSKSKSHNSSNNNMNYYPIMRKTNTLKKQKIAGDYVYKDSI